MRTLLEQHGIFRPTTLKELIREQEEKKKNDKRTY